MQALVFEIRNLRNKVVTYNKNNEYVYTNAFTSWVKEYNSLLEKYNTLVELRISPMTYNEYDLSSTGKTVRNTTIEYFSNSIEALANKIESDVDIERLKTSESEVPAHQMRKCFKLCVDGCPVNPAYTKNKVFIAMPFLDEYLDSYLNLKNIMRP